MIRLEKGEQPKILKQKAGEWTKAVMDRLKKGEKPTSAERSRYRHPEIKDALVKETHGKCAYCESKLRHVAYGDVEHVLPKSGEPANWFSWPNLTLACDVCNTKKGDTPVDSESFVDPYAVDPEELFWQLGPTMHHKPGCDAAAFTERLLDLNRAELVERRTERQGRLLALLSTVQRCQNAQLKQLLWEEFVAESDARNEYAALSRAIVATARERLGFG